VHLVSRGSIDILRARDISTGGVGVRVPHAFCGCDVESDVELVITLPGERPFSARGRVRHRGASDAAPFFGVEFTEIDAAHRDRIRHYVERRLRIGSA